jgi:hypothetical protein
MNPEHVRGNWELPTLSQSHGCRLRSCLACGLPWPTRPALRCLLWRKDTLSVGGSYSNLIRQFSWVVAPHASASLAETLKIIPTSANSSSMRAAKLLPSSKGNDCADGTINDPIDATFYEHYKGSFYHIILNDQCYGDPRIAGCSASCRAPWGRTGVRPFRGVVRLK